MPSIESAGPVRRMLAEVEEIRRASCRAHAGTHYGCVPDMPAIGAALTALAADHDLFAPAIKALPAGRTSATWLHLPDRGPRLALVHRPAGHMAHVHSHHVWVTLAPITGAETHEVYDARRFAHGKAALNMTSFQTLSPGQSAHLIPPGDVHSHGHIAGTGPAPYTLVLLGDNMLRHRREEYDITPPAWRYLPPGDEGQQDRPLTRFGV